MYRFWELDLNNIDEENSCCRTGDKYPRIRVRHQNSTKISSCISVSTPSHWNDKIDQIRSIDYQSGMHWLRKKCFSMVSYQSYTIFFYNNHVWRQQEVIAHKITSFYFRFIRRICTPTFKFFLSLLKEWALSLTTI